MASSTVNLKALGLNFSPNALELPAGSLLEANNVIIRRDDVIESRRGYKLFGEEIPSLQTVKQLAVYRQRILRHYGDKIAYQDGVLNSGEAKFSEFAGSFTEVETGLRLKSIQAKNGNFYFTTNEGIKKISAANADELTTNADYITQAGGIKALDLQAKTDYTFGDQSSFLTENSTVAYKLVWGKVDANNVELLGTPSERVVVYNPLKTLLQMDFNRLLTTLDDLSSANSLINSADYYSTLKVTNETNASDLRANMIALAKKIDEDLVFATDVGSGAAYQPLNISSITASSGVVSIIFSAGTPSNYFSVASKIFITNLKSGTVGNYIDIDGLNGAQVIASVDDATSKITFVARDYTSANSQGISGAISGYPTLAAAGAILITTAATHGLKTGQRVTIANADAAINGTKTVTVKSPNTFEVTATAAITVAGTSGIWTISVDDISSSQVQSNKYRLITEPIEVTANTDTGIVDTRGTGAQLFSQQTYLNTIISNLKAETNSVINTVHSTNIGLETFSLTKNASVNLEFTVPHNIDSTYYYKLYRTETIQASSAYSSPLEDILPGVDYRLAIQNYYDSTLKTATNTLVINDNIPVAFLNKENLYTNINTSGGEDSKPNDYPPFAHDINLFKGYTFYGNTKIKQIKDLELLGVSKFKDEIDAGRTPKVLISDGSVYNNCEITFVRGVKQVTVITIPATPLTSPATSPSTNYIDINSANDETQYRIWFDLTGSNVAPLAGSKKLVKVFIPSNTQDPFGQKLANALNMFVSDFSATYNSATNQITINNLNDGASSAIVFGSGLLVGFSALITTAGVGESVSNKTAVISSNDLLLPSVATQEATKSFIRILNRNTADQVDNPSVGFDTYAYYSNTNPGLFLLEGTTFVDSPYYLVANNQAIGYSFSPDISPLKTTGTTIATAGVGVATITFSVAHGFLNGDTIVITNSNSSPDIDGVYTVEYIDSTHLKIQASVTVAGTSFSYSKSTLAEFSDNYTKKNRIYYSKFEQPEAVSVNVLTGNYIDVGSEEKKILRIFPLRDSLFIFKEDGLYRLSAETEPFIVALFDSSCILAAADSVAVSQNLVYCWTTQGISTVSESGVSIASRPIDTEVLKLQSANYPNFTTATFGVGYESDNSYIVWTISKPSDQYATQAFRYSSLTGTWTKYTKTNNCGILNPVDDRLYLGLPTLSYIEQERKSFTRTDYADYEHNFSLGANNYFDNVLKISSTSGIVDGDVVTQVQTLTIYQFNSLLQKLDNDPGIGDSNYYSTLKAVGGDNLRTKLVALANKLDADPSIVTSDFYATISAKSGAITGATLTSPTTISSASHGLFTDRIITISGATTYPDINGLFPISYVSSNEFTIPLNLISITSGGTWVTNDNDFNDIAACYNKVCEKLNNDSSVAFSNYLPIEGTSLLEAVITNVDYVFKKVTLNETLEFVQGPIVVYSAIQSSVVYAPNAFGDPLSFKQVREATAMFASKAFTLAKLSFATDLLPSFVDVEFSGDGSGLFGNDDFGYNYFGGGSNSAPFRTFIPANCQRCRYLNVKFSHNTAREQYALFGITLTGRTVSTRAYR